MVWFRSCIPFRFSNFSTALCSFISAFGLLYLSCLTRSITTLAVFPLLINKLSRNFMSVIKVINFDKINFVDKIFVKLPSFSNSNSSVQSCLGVSTTFCGAQRNWPQPWYHFLIGESCVFVTVISRNYSKLFTLLLSSIVVISCIAIGLSAHRTFLFFAVYVIYKKNYSFSRVVFFSFLSNQNC